MSIEHSPARSGRAPSAHTPPARAPPQGPAVKFMTRRQLVDHLNEHGYPISLSTMNKLCMPSRGNGPPAEGIWGKNELYSPERGLRWARERFRSSRTPD
jgi:hypothetical protein